MGSQRRYNIPVETAWTVIPFILFMGMFIWGAKLYFEIERPPDNAIPMYAVAKQWMWKIQHPEGQREINELHIPVGRPVKLTMTSQDVIHSFFVPAFRTKQDVLPGRYTMIWFEATKPGKYHLFCAEYCGTKHSRDDRLGLRDDPAEYQNWLTQGAPKVRLPRAAKSTFTSSAAPIAITLTIRAGVRIFAIYICGRSRSDGQTVIADDSYIRESILRPRRQDRLWVFARIMPNFTGSVSEEQIIALIAYIKALGPQPGAQEPSSSGSRSHGIRNAERHRWTRRYLDIRITGWRSDEMIQAVAAKIAKELPDRKAGTPLLAAHHRSQADRDSLHAFHHGLFLSRRILRTDDATGTSLARNWLVSPRLTTSCSRCTGSSWSGSS